MQVGTPKDLADMNLISLIENTLIYFYFRYFKKWN